MIETTCPCCGSELSLQANAVILGRRIPTGDGTAAYICTRCAEPVSLALTDDEVMAAVFAGAKPIDVESVA